MEDETYLRGIICCCIPTLQYIIVGIVFCNTFISEKQIIINASTLCSVVFVCHMLCIRRWICFRIHKIRWGFMFILNLTVIIVNAINAINVDFDMISKDVLIVLIDALIIPIYTLVVLALFIKKEKYIIDDYDEYFEN